MNFLNSKFRIFIFSAMFMFVAGSEASFIHPTMAIAAGASKQEVQNTAKAPVVPPLTPQNHSVLPGEGAKTPADSVFPSGPAGDAARAYASGDMAKARKIWEEMAKNGDGQAMNNLGALYDQGQGVEPDAGRAFHWFAQSANAGNPSGMNNYGRMLEQGRGVPANPEEAARWFDMAARQGQPEAQYNLGFLYENGRGVPRDDAAAAAWYSRAASMRQKDALARLGHFYRIGKGVDKNPQRGVLLLYAAAMEGSNPAIAELEEMARDSPPKSQAVLFSQKLDATNRNAMREALKKSATPAKREDNDHICDVYDVTKTVPGASEMAVCYGPQDRLAFLKIDYAAPTNSRADAVIQMVESRFGKPTAGEGEDAKIWNLGSVIVATQYAPTHGQISLMYMVPAVYHQTRTSK